MVVTSSFLNETMGDYVKEIQNNVIAENGYSEVPNGYTYR